MTAPEQSLNDVRVPPAVAAYRNAARMYDIVLEPPLRGMRRAVSALAGAGPGMRILDVCCGTGVQARLLSDTGAEVAAADMSPHMLNKARARANSRLYLLLASADRLPFADGAFDLVFNSLSLHEIPEILRLAFTAELRRVARPGGRIMVMDYGTPEKSGLSVLPFQSACRLAERMAGGTHYRNYCEWMARGALRGFAARAGLHGEIHKYYGGAMGVLIAAATGS